MVRPAGCYLFGLAILAMAMLGCRQDSSRATIRGNVTLDGRPLKSGIIRLVPSDGRSATADAQITDGAFTVTAPIGEKRVEITAPKVVGTRKMYEGPGTPTVEVVEELLPARYNLQSTLTLTVVAGGQEKDFPLTSEK